MLASRYRFHGYGSLKYVYNRGQTSRVNMMSLRYCPNPRRANSRVAVVVSKKVAKKAVTRNQIRRRIYEIIRAKIPNIKQPHDLVFTIFDKRILEMEFDKLTQQIDELLTKAHII